MDLNQKLAVIALVVALIAIVVGALAARRWGTRRRRLLFEYTSTALIAEGQLSGSGKDYLKVTYRDFEVPDPHLVRVSLKNVGPADVASGHFDAGKPVTIKLHCTMFGVTAVSHPESTESCPVGAEAVLKLGPQLLRRGEEWFVDAVVGGTPRPEVMSSLIDTDIVDEPTFSAALARSLPYALAEGVLAPVFVKELIFDLVAKRISSSGKRR